ncbi:MAG: CCDC90 family protein [Thiobacillaceae bacterium]|nr:CCDC90 family protein [Thiobacillaceae bacterium]MCX7672634.1 CCDC90 family protein [Thiobacillaceae bacterium]MDW8323649.1 DUF1640 domain-containing protein [Burkholderiales bacterium]
MTTIVFDSYALVKRLKEAGFTEQQAETLIDAAKDALVQLATREDLENLKKDLNRDLTIRFGIMLAAAVGILTAILKTPLG